MNRISRRSFFGSGVGVALLPSASPEVVHHFVTPHYQVRMTLEFYDRYASQGFPFEEKLSHRHFCLSGRGEQDRNCLDGFRGAIAVACYQVRPRIHSSAMPTMREFVRSIDRSEHFPLRPPFERTIATQQGVASDVQVFGYQENSAVPQEARPDGDHLWCLLRQDLYLADKAAPFLVVHWKHTLRAIRVLDIIPGVGTSVIENRTGRK